MSPAVWPLARCIQAFLSLLPLIIEPDSYLDNLKKKLIKLIKNKDHLIGDLRLQRTDTWLLQLSGINFTHLSCIEVTNSTPQKDIHQLNQELQKQGFNTLIG